MSLVLVPQAGKQGSYRPRKQLMPNQVREATDIKAVKVLRSCQVYASNSRSTDLVTLELFIHRIKEQDVWTHFNTTCLFCHLRDLR